MRHIRNSLVVLFGIFVVATMGVGLTPEGATAAWEEQWNGWISAARQEGKVVVYGSTTPELRVQLPKAFEKRFGIKMEYNALKGRELASRIRAERAAGIFNADAVIAGAGSTFTVVAKKGKIKNGMMGFAAPMRPVLILPEVLDTSKYFGNKLWFMDPSGKYVLRLSYRVQPDLFLNTKYVKKSELKAWTDLLKPKYKGKIIAYDPSRSGAGIARAAQVYHKFGEEFMRKLYIGQEAFITRDHRQIADQLARGAYPIALNFRESEVARLKRAGYFIDISGHLAGTLPATSGGRSYLTMMDKAPNPNAAKVFVNWLASQEGLAVYSRASREFPVRKDVDRSKYPEFMVPQDGVEYDDLQRWDSSVNIQPKVKKLMKKMLRTR